MPSSKHLEVPVSSEMAHENELLELYGFKNIPELSEADAFDDDPFEHLSPDELKAVAGRAYEIDLPKATSLHTIVKGIAERRTAEQFIARRSARVIQKQTDINQQPGVQKAAEPKPTQGTMPEGRPTIAVKKIVTVNHNPDSAESRWPKVNRRFLDKVAVGVASLGIATGGVSAGMAIKTRDAANQAWENSQLVSGHIPGSVYDPYTDAYYDETTGELLGRDYSYSQYQDQVDTAHEKYAKAGKYEDAALGGIALFAVGMAGYTALGLRRKD